MQIYKTLLEWGVMYWVTIILIVHTSISLITSLHIILFKENERTSLAWIGLVVFSPILGSMFYWLFGINRIRRSAKRIFGRALNEEEMPHESRIDTHKQPHNWQGAMVAGYAIHPIDYLDNNGIELLVNGDMAYPAMLQSIENAKSNIMLSSYIFEYDSLGRQFVEALINAHQRGVLVHVLLDGVGISYSWQKSDRLLKKMGVKTARFLPTISLSSIRFVNLRNHRKILCIDGKEAYVGGMNISENNLVESSSKPIDDIHFKVVGPVLDQISHVFLDDWLFATGELIEFPSYQAGLSATHVAQTIVARVIQDGPDEDHNKIRWTLINALASAQKTVKIMTPYFVPDSILMTSLHAASMRGVSVEIIVPQHSNILFMNWVMQANFSRIIEHGIKIYQNTRPFDHSKMLVIDDIWSFIGSTNWDARSLEFNFEINLECFDKELNTKLTSFFVSKKQNAVLVTTQDIEAIPIIFKARNNLFRLFTPYL
jgi:cardiolipin synthase